MVAVASQGHKTRASRAQGPSKLTSAHGFVPTRRSPYRSNRLSPSSKLGVTKSVGERDPVEPDLDLARLQGADDGGEPRVLHGPSVARRAPDLPGSRALRSRHPARPG